MKTVLLHDNYSINSDGYFTVCGHDTTLLAKQYGTPLYLIDEDKVRQMCRAYTSCAKKYFEECEILYASKALSFKEIYRVAHSEKMSVDTVSCGEMYTALSAGFPAEKIYFHGNNKTKADIEFAVKNGVGCFVADNERELSLIDECASKYGKIQNVILRITPGVDPHTHVKIATGNVDSKFGVSVETGQADGFVKEALSKKNLKLLGYHCHVGSQSFDPQPFLDAADIMFKFIADMKAKYGFEAEVLNLGGGFGVRYLPEQENLDIEFMFSKIAQNAKANCEKHGLTMPKMLFEPGRSLVAAAGVTLYTVGNIKTITGYKSYISVDGGMADNPRYALYEAPYYALVANRANEDMDFVADIAGCCCESGDIIQPNVTIQRANPDDILAVCVTGAYNYSMASNYNRLPRPALLLLSKDGVRVGVKRETYEDIVRNDI